MFKLSSHKVFDWPDKRIYVLKYYSWAYITMEYCLLTSWPHFVVGRIENPFPRSYILFKREVSPGG